ncbi:MAG: CopD family protein [Gammaproteobacteria bacterium]|nr:CopD family protein [Gammaproteobacteria bacterium]
MQSVALTLHLLAAVIWVGGMFFSYVLLRPVLGTMDEQQRLVLWMKTFKKFFPWVWLSIAVLLATGFYMIFAMGGFAVIRNPVIAMMVLGIVMMLIFKFIYVAPFHHLCRGIREEKWKVAAYALGTIRKLIAVNLVLGTLIFVVAVAL